MRDDYFEWLYDLVCPDNRYKKLCIFLHNTDFTYDLPMDGNRYEDGVSLRYRYAYVTDQPEHRVAEEIDNRPCSVFEMMVALALRMEEDVMAQPDGDRTATWFREMLSSLGIGDMTNERFDELRVRRTINNFLRRDYEKTGRGGLFTIDNVPDRDLRKVEIWYQAMWHLNDVLKEGGRR